MKSYPYTIDNGQGELLTFTGVTQGPEGERALADGVAKPGAGPPMHVHYLQEEAARVISGRLGYQVPGREPPGSVVLQGQPGAVHGPSPGTEEALTAPPASGRASRPHPPRPPIPGERSR